jgi:hypothetical protein
MGYVSPQHNLLCLGHIPCGEQPALTSPLRSNESDHSIGISGCCSSLSNSIVVGPTEIVIDWGWVEKFLLFVSTNKDIRPVGATMALDYEDLLERSCSTPDKKRIGSHTPASLEFHALSLTIPLHNVITDDRSEQQYLIAAANHFHVKTVNLYDSFSKEQKFGKESNVYSLSNQDLVRVSVSRVLRQCFFH